MYFIFLFIFLLASSLTPPRSDSASIASKAKESSDTSISDEDISSAEDGEIVDKESLEWELALKTVLMEDKKDLPDGLESFVNTARSYGDVAGDTIMNDALMMPIGFGIVFVYVTIMLGKFSCTEQRALLALGGLLCIGLTIGFTYGFCSAINLFYGPMHNIIPFLLLGIGIDDMFVIIQCYDNLGSEKSQDNVENIGRTMRHAGVAITVTSLTDFIVFVLGATTVLPALRSFCPITISPPCEPSMLPVQERYRMILKKERFGGTCDILLMAKNKTGKQDMLVS